MGDLRGRAVIITGAGLSADSGVRTYRGEGGIYSGMRAEVVMSAWTMKHNPETVQRFCDDRRQELAGKHPNAAHEMIGRLMREYPGRVDHFTQNVDGLGPAGTVELHGRLTRMRSIGNSTVKEDIGFARYWDGDPTSAPARGFQFRCPKTNSRYRPDVILFEEPAPEYSKLWRAVKRLRLQDVLVVIGTQGNVLPVSEFAAQAPCPAVLNNLHESGDIDPDFFAVTLMERATTAAPAIEEFVRNRLGLPQPSHA